MLSVILYYVWGLALLLIVTIPIGILLSKIGENKINVLSDENNKLNNTIKSLLGDKIKLADEEFFLKRKQLSFGIVNDYILHYLTSKLRFEKTISIVNNFFVYGFLNILITVVFATSCFAVLFKWITFGTMEALQLYISQLWGPIERIVNLRKKYLNDKPYINEFADALHLPQ